MIEESNKALKDTQSNLIVIQKKYEDASKFTSECSKKVFEAKNLTECDISIAVGKAHAIINSNSQSKIIEFENNLQANENTQELINALVSWNKAHQNEIDLLQMVERAKKEVIVAEELVEILQ